MRNKKIEWNINLVREFISQWQDFGNFLHLPPDRDISPEDEQKFMEMKSMIARRCQVLQESLEQGFLAESKILDILSQSPELKQILTQPMHAKKLQNDWHAAYISLNKLLGSLEAKKAELARVSRFGFSFRNFVRHPLTTLVFLIAVIMLFYALLASFLTPEKISALKDKIPFLSGESTGDTEQQE
ncbi:MAG: hypothetical protein GXO71_07660 [Caldiserica bacterium]|nr:hypothetical protein [Caldisericota bacterium]